MGAGKTEGQCRVGGGARAARDSRWARMAVITRGRQDAESGHERARDARDERVEQALELLARRRHGAMETRAFPLKV